MEFKNNIPIYLQIKKYLYRQIITGKLSPGSKIPSIRDLAAEWAVNINTVQRALMQMSDEGVLYTKRGEGNFVTRNIDMLDETKKQLIYAELDKFVQNMKSLGGNDNQIASILTVFLKVGV